MASTTLSPGRAVHGGTALGVCPAHPRHRLGSALRAVRVYAASAVEVVVLGSDGEEVLSTSRHPM
ncbi:hypothetical protein [Actinacidiphila sp. ITFR-21]|uniref:hypothetical protein n=1 Tax=Actinacidiphila sp. ITFR-21 TaxID=3075199 RepID=UPI00288C1029|nr:hypothetical protein [Streptomyces sp. ITFR-21]WNI16008.1 hypothetical protein RLT57_11050 [Streptomyces sp. ITFR-21]